jgi:hypothetical protein
MTGLETVLAEIDAVGGHLNRRAFFQLAAGALVVTSGTLDADDERFFRRVTATLVAAGALETTGIDPVANLRHLLERTRADHRVRIGRLITGLRRIAFLYGGEQVAVRGRSSRFVLMRKASRALASLCLLCVWGDPRSFTLVDDPGGLP